MALYTWRNVSGSAGGQFDVANNWANPNESISTTVPSAGDAASFTFGGGPIYGTGSVDTIAFAAAGWTIVGQLTAGTVTVNNSQVAAAGNGQQLVITRALQVGLNGTAGLSVVNGGSLTVTAASGSSASSFGSASLTVANRGLASFGGGLDLATPNTSTSAVVDAAVLAVGGILQVGAGGQASLAVQNGAQLVLSAAIDTSTPYLRIGAVTSGPGAALSVAGANSLLLLANNSASVGYRGAGSLTVSGGASARFNASASASNNALNPALTIGLAGTGGVAVVGTGSLLAAGGSIIVGSSAQGTLRLQSGASATSMGFVAGQAALAVGAAAGGSGTVIIDGPGTSLMAYGAVVLGGDNRGSGLTAGGTGTVSVSGGGLFSGGDTTVLRGSSVSIDGSSQGSFNSLNVAGSLTSNGTFVVGGVLFGGGSVTIGGGVADIGSLGGAGLTPASVTFGSSAASLRLHGIVGANTVSAMRVGDEIDFLGNTSVRLFGTTLTTTTGTIALSDAPAGSHYEIGSDGAGGTTVSISVDTIGVYRFFDSNYGTHFFSAAASEKNTILATRPDLVYEGVGLQSIDPTAGDPNAVPVYRFFDLTYGTHFFTASASERDTVIASRSDLVFEGTGFLEHTAQQAGDTAVYRFFDTKFGTHFYTADNSERATIVATRPDLLYEGIGFYAPP